MVPEGVLKLTMYYQPERKAVLLNQGQDCELEQTIWPGLGGSKKKEGD